MRSHSLTETRSIIYGCWCYLCFYLKVFNCATNSRLYFVQFCKVSWALCEEFLNRLFGILQKMGKITFAKWSSFYVQVYRYLMRIYGETLRQLLARLCCVFYENVDFMVVSSLTLLLIHSCDLRKFSRKVLSFPQPPINFPWIYNATKSNLTI